MRSRYSIVKDQLVPASRRGLRLYCNLAPVESDLRASDPTIYTRPVSQPTSAEIDRFTPSRRGQSGVSPRLCVGSADGFDLNDTGLIDIGESCPLQIPRPRLLERLRLLSIEPAHPEWVE